MPRVDDPADRLGQNYGSRTNDERRLLNHVLFRRLYLADNRITGYESPDGDTPARVTPTPPATTP